VRGSQNNQGKNNVLDGGDIITDGAKQH